MDFSRPENPTDNSLILSFNGILQDEFPNIHWLLSLYDVCQKIEQWRHDYNSYLPHSSLGKSTPDEFAEANRQNWKSLFLACAGNRCGSQLPESSIFH